ncbi:MAG: phospholipid carrier-dependent glycosyltransferase [Calditrichaeota bacterium]|nr:MAG: phospholipid carrier-dependent glycosyltransferase [Calditrichota bacterium]
MLLTLSITHADVSHWILVEPAAGFMVTLALYLLLRFADAPSVRNNMVAGLVCGLAISTKYNAGFLFVPLLAAVVSRFKSRGVELLKQGLLATASLVLGFLLGSPYWIPRFSAYMNDLHYTLNHVGAGMVGHVRTVPFLWPILELLLREWTVGVLFVAGVVYLLFNRSRNFWLLGAFVLPTLLFVGSWTRTGIHYLLPLFPALAVLAALFLDGVLRLSRARAVSYVVLVVLLLPPAAKIVLHDVRLTRRDVRSEAKAWVETHLPEGSVIAYENYVYGPNLYDPMRFFKNEEENRLLPVELKERLLQERRKRPSYRLVNLRKDFRLRILHEKGATGRTKGNLYLRQLLDRRLPKLAALKKAGIPYLMVSSDNYARYFKTEEPEKGTALWLSYQNGRHFYGGLFRSPDWVLVQEFKRGFWNLGPTIRIYRAREQTESGP